VAEVTFQSRGRRSGYRRQCHSSQHLIESGELGGRLDEPAFHEDDATDETAQLGVTRERLEHDEGAERMTDQHRSIECERLDQAREVGREGREVVAVVRFVGEPVSSEVGREDAVAGSRDSLRDGLPAPGGGGQAVQEQERSRVGRRFGRGPGRAPGQHVKARSPHADEHLPSH
jgi:hypothetical protein